MCTRSRVLLLASVVALGGWLWVGSKPFAPPPAVADEFTVSGPFTHGNLTVFLLRGPDAERSRPVLGLDEALARQCAVVHETGSVNELVVENTSEEDDLLLLSGDIVKGGKQDRVLQATMILPPKSGKVPVRSFCVEQSRWTNRGGEHVTRFGGNTATIAGKELKQAVQVAGSQGAVWHNVQAQQAALSRTVGTTVNSAASPTSLQLTLENDQLQAEVAKFRTAITTKVGDPAGVVGFVMVVNGQVTGAEAFGSHAIFRKAWTKAVNAAAVEAVAARENRTFTEMTSAGVRTFLARAGNEERETVNTLVEAPDEPRELSMTLHLPGVDPSPTPFNPFMPAPTEVNPLRGVPIRVRSRILDNTASLGVTQNAADNLSPQPGSPAKTAVVEYREPGGAVIHRSFLPR